MNKLVIPRNGYVFISAGEASNPVPLSAFSLNRPVAAPSGWEWFGSASATNPFQMEHLDNPGSPEFFDGESNTLGSRPTFIKWSFGSLIGAPGTFRHVLGGSVFDQSLGAWATDELRPTYRSVTVIFQRGTERSGFYFRRVKLFGRLDLEPDRAEFLEFGLDGYVQKPDVNTWGKILTFEKQ